MKNLQKNNVEHIVPFEKFSQWFRDAQDDSRIVEPTAMCLATCDKNSKPSSRMILLKKFDKTGFCFFTNFNSRKASQLKENPYAALCFYWGALGRQVRIEGKIEEVSKLEADEYFASRRKESRIGAWASQQSQIMENWQEFEDRIDHFAKKFENQDVPRPEFWSGFRLVPEMIEFWEEGDFRIHHRTVYEKTDSEIGWVVNLIYP